MKIVINYDLIDKINQSQGKCKLQRMTKQYFKAPLTWIANINWTLAFVSFNSGNAEDINSILIKFLVSIGITYPSIMGGTLILSNILEKKGVYSDKKQAYMKLQELSAQLKSLNIETSAELLKDAEAYYHNYKVEKNDKGIPRLVQNKYINIPVYNDGKIEEKSIVQEHKIGSKQYVLSIGSYHQSPSYQKAYNM